MMYYLDYNELIHACISCFSWHVFTGSKILLLNKEARGGGSKSFIAMRTYRFMQIRECDVRGTCLLHAWSGSQTGISVLVSMSCLKRATLIDCLRSTSRHNSGKKDFIAERTS